MYIVAARSLRPAASDANCVIVTSAGRRVMTILLPAALEYMLHLARLTYTKNRVTWTNTPGLRIQTQVY